MDKAVIDLLEALEFARSQDAEVLHMDLTYGEWNDDRLGAMIDNAVEAYRNAADFRRVAKTP